MVGGLVRGSLCISGDSMLLVSGHSVKDLKWNGKNMLDSNYPNQDRSVMQNESLDCHVLRLK